MPLLFAFLKTTNGIYAVIVGSKAHSFLCFLWHICYILWPNLGARNGSQLFAILSVSTFLNFA